MKKKVILVSGGKGRLASEFERQGRNCGHLVISLDRTLMDVTDKPSVDAAISTHKPDVLIHCAAVRPGGEVQQLLAVNIVGTVNIVQACHEQHVKLVYISTDHVYPKAGASHTEESPLLPFTSYGWTKLGGECAVRTYRNALIIRGAMCERPYPHEEAYTDVHKNLIYQDTAVSYVLQLLDETGVINVGEEASSSLYDFARNSRKDVRPVPSPPQYEPKYSHLSVEKLQGMVRRRSTNAFD